MNYSRAKIKAQTMNSTEPMTFTLEFKRDGAKTGNAARHARQLADALGNGAEWEYRGECCERPQADGVCACGQTGIKYEFYIYHPTRGRKIVGSSCILSYRGITPELAERLEADLSRLLAEGRERERKAREAARADEVQDLMRQWSAAQYATDAACQSWQDRNGPRAWKPYGIYTRGDYMRRLAERDERAARGELHPFCRLPQLKTSAGQAKRLRQYLAKCEQELKAAQI